MQLTILTFNVNGLRQILKKETLVSFLKKEKPDILCIQEAKMTSTELHLVSLEGYELVSHSLGKRKGYAGVMTFARDSIASNATSFNQDDPSLTSLPKEASDEGRVCVIKYKDWCIVNVYTPNSGSGKGVDTLKRLDYRVDTWDRKFETFVVSLIKSYNSKLVICGDLNVAHTEMDIARPNSNLHHAGYTQRERSSFTSILKSTNLLDTFRHVHGADAVQYTYWSYMGRSRDRNVGWRIDYFLVPKVNVKNVKSLTTFKDVTGSDHCPVVLEIIV